MAWNIDCVCENIDCDNYGEIVNTIHNIKSKGNAYMLLEDASFTPDDVCKKCGQTGTFMEPYKAEVVTLADLRLKCMKQRNVIPA